MISTRLTGAVLLVARVLLAAEFLVFGALKLVNTRSMQGYMAAHGVPGVLIWPAILVQLSAGALIVLGLWTRWAALALAGFCIVATSLFHNDFSNLGEVSNFTKDLAATGGFLFVAVFGPGPISIDQWLSRGRKSFDAVQAHN
jgi:putative oxidoreductase